MKRYLMLITSLAVLVAVLAVGLLFAYVQVAERPSNARNWSRDQRVVPHAVFGGHSVTIHNVRNFVYRTATDYDERRDTRTYDLDRIEKAWFIVERFGAEPVTAPGIAHTFMTFAIGGEYVAVSIEIRKEEGERFSPIKGLLRQYELMYVIADERDVIGLRTNIRRDPVYMYPVTATPEQLRKLFVDMLLRANRLESKPEFYNTLTNNCTTSIVDHVNTIAPLVPFSYRIVLPAFSDELAYDLGLIPGGRPFEAVRAAHRIDLAAQKHPIDEQFSIRIRQGAGSSESASPSAITLATATPATPVIKSDSTSSSNSTRATRTDTK